MYRTAALLPLLAHLASASISLVTYGAANCNGETTDNILSDPANQFQSSGCAALNRFSAIEVVSAEPGFTCHVYSDRACANFIDTFSTPNECVSIIGQGVTCFSQAAFDNPLDGARGELSVGTVFVTTTRTGGDLIRQGVRQGCGDSACDPNNSFSEEVNPEFKRGTFTVSLEGNYDSTDQRDYMSSVLQRAFDLAQTPDRSNGAAFLNGQGTLDNPFVRDVPSFGQVVLNDARGNNIAEMSVTLTHTPSQAQKNCQSAIGRIAASALQAIPVVGGFAGLVYRVACS